jgi:hypothetical protein
MGEDVARKRRGDRHVAAVAEPPPGAAAYHESIKPWNQRVQDAINEAEVYRRPGKKFAYRVDGQAAALMRVTVGEDALQVEDLSSHPGSAGAGEIRIEKAVNVSAGCGKGGRVKLFAVERAGGFYAKLGCASIDGNSRELRPAAAAGWARLSDGKWRLQKDPSSTRFIAGLSESPENVEGVEEPWLPKRCWISPDGWRPFRGRRPRGRTCGKSPPATRPPTPSRTPATPPAPPSASSSGTARNRGWPGPSGETPGPCRPCASR